MKKRERERELETFLHEDNTSSSYHELLNENPEYLTEEQALSNLIELSFPQLDVKSSVLDELNKSNQKPVSDFALNIVDELKQTETKKTETLRLIIFAAAALIVLSLVFIGPPQERSEYIVTHTTQAPTNLKTEEKSLKINFPQVATKPQVISPENEIKSDLAKGDSVKGEACLNSRKE